MNSLENEINIILRDLEKPSRYTGGEFNSPRISVQDTDSSFNFCFVYPDCYEVGFPNQAMRILCNCINDMEGFLAQRAFLPKPDALEVFRDNCIEMFSVETKSPLKQFDAIGITVSHELAATNVLEVIDFSGIEVLAAKRKDKDPIIIGGGPMCCNPEPFSDFFDVIAIGEAEKTLPAALEFIKEHRLLNTPRKDIIEGLASLESMYVPSLFEFDNQVGCAVPINKKVKSVITKSVYTDFINEGAYSNCIVPFVEVTHDRLNVEILRGCARGCRFCQAGMMYRPVRERNCKTVCEAAQRGLDRTGYDEVSLTSLSTTDHSEIRDILSTLNDNFQEKDIRISIPSQRLDNFDTDMALLVSGNKKGGLTFAIEAGSQRLRDVINKNVCEEDLFRAVDSAFRAGWNRCKLYFMIGLPFETDDDVVQIAELCEKVYECAINAVDNKRKSGVMISASVAVFVPKAQTPFQWSGIIEPDEALRRVKLIKCNLRSRNIKISYHEPWGSLIEALISRGGREVGSLIYQAWKNGAKFDSWNEFFNYQYWEKASSDCGVNIKSIACSTYDTCQVMPWEHISLGIDRDFLETEMKKAREALTTPDCTFTKCNKCGVCGNLKVKNITNR